MLSGYWIDSIFDRLCKTVERVSDNHRKKNTIEEEKIKHIVDEYLKEKENEKSDQ